MTTPRSDNPPAAKKTADWGSLDWLESVGCQKLRIQAAAFRLAWSLTEIAGNSAAFVQNTQSDLDPSKTTLKFESQVLFAQPTPSSVLVKYME